VQHDLLMSAALEQATRGLDAGEVPIGAVAALEGEILAAAFWRLEDGLLAHRELLVPLEADRSADIAGQRGDLALYTTLEACLLCMSAAMFSSCGRIVYALESPTDGGTSIGSAGIPAATRRRTVSPEVIGGVRREDSLELVRKYLRRAAPSPVATWAQTLVA
jgi:tRNA(adenine34) deaminase